MKDKLQVFDGSPERASLNGTANISDWGITDIIHHLDEHTEKDSEFFESFTRAMFAEFGWTFHSKEAGDESWDEKKMRTDAEDRGLIAGYKPNRLSFYLVMHLSGRDNEMIQQMWKDMDEYKL
jgi:hypothetical protein|tara:strand:+ start:6174 stop:6542 length:369 start_codon:yes stop_codon:yes gene_type:complete